MTDFFSTEPRLPVSFQKAAVYARYSTVMQRPSSIDDQLRSCQEYADQVGWTILDNHVYIDSAKSGTTTVGRDGFAALKQAAEQRPIPFDCVLIARYLSSGP